MLSHLPLPCDRGLYHWAINFLNRFPSWFDVSLIKGFHSLLSGTHSSFFQARPPLQLKRLLLTQFFLQKQMERALNLKKKSPFYTRIFSFNSRLCITVAYPKGTSALTATDILDIANQRVPALRQVNFSSYQWLCQDLPYFIYYVELEKMRGDSLTLKELRTLEYHLKEHLPKQTASYSIFWPYNHEEAFKQLLILDKEISSPTDYPEVSIRFQKQTLEGLEFLIYLVRPKSQTSPVTAMTSSLFPRSIQFISHLIKPLDVKIPTLAEAFSLILPLENFKTRNTVNLLHAREFIAKFLHDTIGIFRDYNGGLFETQKSRFDKLTETFSSKIPNFSLFGEDLFYSLLPIEAQLCLDLSLLKKLFISFSHILSKTAPTLNSPNPYVLILKSQDKLKIASWVKRASKLHEEGKVTAYAKVNVLSDVYLCLIEATGKHLKPALFSSESSNHSTDNHRTLRLAFQTGELPSFYPYHLAKEMRGRTIGKLLFEGLFRLKPQNQIEPAGCLNVTLSKNNKRYLFELRSNYWSNGQKVTAFQYEKTWKQNLSARTDLNPFYILKNAQAIRKGAKPLSSLGVKALDSTHLEVNLEREDPHFLAKLTHPTFFPSLEGYSEAKHFNGPYHIQTKTKQALLLEKNPYYWDKHHLFFDEISILFETSSRKIYNLFQKAKIDWVGNPCHYEVTLPNPLEVKESLYPFFIYFNTQLLPLSSPSIRRAFSSVLNRQSIATHIFPGYQPLLTPLPKALSLCTSPLTDNDRVQGKALFEQGLSELGLTRATFPRLKLSACNMKRDVKLAKYLQKKWQQAFDIQIDLEIHDWNFFYQKIEQRNFHIGGFFKHLFPLDPFPFLDCFSHKESNFSQWENRAYTELTTSITQAKSKRGIEALFRQAEQLLLKHMPMTPLLSLVYSYSHLPGLKDYVLDQEGSLEFRYAFIEGERPPLNP